MATSALMMSGMDRIRMRLEKAQAKAKTANHDATGEAVALLLEKSRAILDAEVYSKSREPYDEAPDKSDSDALWNSFKEQLKSLSDTASEGKLSNTSDHAIFLEYGTDDEGTGSHFVPVGEKGYLAWMDGATGAIRFSKGHEVKGIVPIRFLARALTENKSEVLGIYRKHYSNLFG